MAIKYLNNIDLNQNELQYAVIQPSTNPPIGLTAKLGQVYYNTTDDKLKIYTSTGWVTVGGGTIPTLQQVVTAGNTIIIPTTIAKGIDITLSDLSTVYQNGTQVTIPLQTGIYPTYQPAPDAYIAYINGQTPGSLAGWIGGFVVEANGDDNIAFFAGLNNTAQNSYGYVSRSTGSHIGTHFVAQKGPIGGPNVDVFIVANNGDTTAKSFIKAGGTSSEFLMANGSTSIAVPFNPSDYDLDEFTNNNVDPFAHVSDIPAVPGLQEVTDIGATTTSAIKIGTGDNFTGEYNLLQPNGFENWFNGGFNWSSPITFQIKREQILNLNIYSFLTVQSNFVSLRAKDTNHESSISAFSTELVLSSYNANDGYELRVFPDRIELSKNTETNNKKINLLLDNTTSNNNYYFPINQGTLALTSDIPAPLGYTPVNKAGDTMLGNLILNADPSNALGAATKQYVDNIVTGINFHVPVVAATDVSLVATYNNGVAGVGATLTGPAVGVLSIDGQFPAYLDRILVWQQTDPIQNGIYNLTRVGNATTIYQLTRSADADNSPPGEILYGDYTLVLAGDANGGFGFICNTPGIINIGTTPINYVQFNAAQVVVAGYGLQELTANVLEIDPTITQEKITFSTTTGTGAATFISNTLNIPTLPQATTSVSGYLSSIDFTTFTNKENSLGNPSTNGYVLSSTTAGIRSWIPMTGGGGGGGTVTNVTGTAPVSVATGTTTPVISMAAATASVNGYLTSANFTIFNNKAGLDSPAFINSPTAPTQGTGLSNTTLATTAFVTNSINAAIPNIGYTIYNILIGNGTGMTSINTQDTGTSGGQPYAQNGRNVMINNGGSAININATLAVDGFIASYTKLGTADITFTVTSPVVFLNNVNGDVINGLPGSTALLTKNGNTVYLLINNI